MKVASSLLTLTLALAYTASAQEYVTPTTPFSRQLLNAPDAATAQSILGVGGSLAGGAISATSVTSTGPITADADGSYVTSHGATLGAEGVNEVATDYIVDSGLNAAVNVVLRTFTDPWQFNDGLTVQTYFKYPVAAGANKVLTSDAYGVASWQNPSGNANMISGPITNSGANAELVITNSGTQNAIILTNGTITINTSTGAGRLTTDVNGNVVSKGSVTGNNGLVAGSSSQLTINSSGNLTTSGTISTTGSGYYNGNLGTSAIGFGGGNYGAIIGGNSTPSYGISLVGQNQIGWLNATTGNTMGNAQYIRPTATGSGTLTIANNVQIPGTLTVTNSVTIIPGAAPGTPIEGQMYYDSSTHHFMGYTSAGWKQLDN